MYPTIPSKKIGVLLGHPNERTKSRLLLQEIRQALRERKILFLVGKKKLVDGTKPGCN